MKLKSTERLIGANLKISSLSVTALKKTGNHNSVVKNCTQVSGTCYANTWHDINWYDSANKKIAGTSSSYVNYDQKGDIVSDQDSFEVGAKMKFYCSLGVSRCQQAESAEVKYTIHPRGDHIASVIRKPSNFQVTIPRVTPEVIETVVDNGRKEFIDNGRKEYVGGSPGGPPPKRTVSTSRGDGDGGDGDGGN